MKFCPDCGKPCEGLKFCGECGFDLRPYIPVVNNITPPEAPQPQTTATAAVGTAQPAQPVKPQMVTAQAQEQTIPDNIEELLKPFVWKLNDDGKTYTITGVKDREIQSAEIPYGVTMIGDDAFEWCKSLKIITIPSSVTSIGRRLFRHGPSPTSVTIPSSVTSIGLNPFCCSSLTSINVEPSNHTYHSTNNCLIETATKTLVAGCRDSVIPSDGSVTSIAPGAFCDASLTNITIPGNITTIGSSAFSCCKALTRITIPYGITSISDHAFFSCLSLSNITIPNSVKSIGNRAFASCEALTNITIPSSVKSIDECAFYWCKSLRKAYIPQHTKLGNSAFPATCQVIRT